MMTANQKENLRKSPGFAKMFTSPIQNTSGNFLNDLEKSNRVLFSYDQNSVDKQLIVDTTFSNDGMSTNLGDSSAVKGFDSTMPDDNSNLIKVLGVNNSSKDLLESGQKLQYPKEKSDFFSPSAMNGKKQIHDNKSGYKYKTYKYQT